jgi:hypothetical protein
VKTGRFEQRKTVSGNALLIVLIGIILFAALIFSLSRGRSVSALSQEDATLYAQQITTFADKVNGAVQTVMLQNNCRDNKISFENPTLGGYVNATSPNKCHIFDSKGGGLTYESPPVAALDSAAAGAGTAGALGDYFFAGNVCVDNIGSGPHATCATDGLANEDLVLILPWVSADVCAAINRILENTDPMLQDANGSYDDTKFTGTFTDGFAIGAAGYTTYHAGCYKSTGGSPGVGYHFYYVLSAR